MKTLLYSSATVYCTVVVQLRYRSVCCGAWSFAPGTTLASPLKSYSSTRTRRRRSLAGVSVPRARRLLCAFERHVLLQYSVLVGAYLYRSKQTNKQTNRDKRSILYRRATFYQRGTLLSVCHFHPHPLPLLFLLCPHMSPASATLFPQHNRTNLPHTLIMLKHFSRISFCSQRTLL